MEVKQFDNIKLYQTMALWTRLFNKGIREAAEINRRNGLPNVLSLNGRIFYELPNGDIVDKNPLDELK